MSIQDNRVIDFINQENEKLKKELEMLRKMKGEAKFGDTFRGYISKLYSEGWRILPTSCMCGGTHAWIDPDQRMYGCICHSFPPIKAMEK